VLSRTLVYALLTAAVVGAYLGLVGAADVVLRRGVGLGSSVLATLLIALGFNPIRVRLQRAVERAIYGDRADPARVLSPWASGCATGRNPTRYWRSWPTRCGCPTSR
jgi:hypothetical protein